MPVGEAPQVDLRLDRFADHARPVLKTGYVDFVVEVPDVTDHCLMLHVAHLLGADDIATTRGGDEDVGGRQHIIELDYLETIHRRLQCTNRVDLGNQHAGALTTQ